MPSNKINHFKIKIQQKFSDHTHHQHSITLECYVNFSYTHTEAIVGRPAQVTQAISAFRLYRKRKKKKKHTVLIQQTYFLT